jgi:hypothetical protein
MGKLTYPDDADTQVAYVLVQGLPAGPFLCRGLDCPGEMIRLSQKEPVVFQNKHSVRSHRRDALALQASLLNASTSGLPGTLFALHKALKEL